MSAIHDLYREAVRRHASDPVGYRQPIEATHRHQRDNPQCGDRVEMRFRVVDGVIEEAAFDGEACAICLASASLLCGLAPGLTVDQLGGLHGRLEAALNRPGAVAGRPAGDGEVDPADGAGLEPQLQPLLGVRPYPSRIDCALLPWQTAQRALERPAGA